MLGIFHCKLTRSDTFSQRCSQHFSGLINFAHRHFTLMFQFTRILNLQVLWTSHLHAQPINKCTYKELACSLSIRTTTKYCMNICSKKCIWLWFVPKLCNIFWNLKYVYNLVRINDFVMVQNVSIINKTDPKCDNGLIVFLSILTKIHEVLHSQ